MQDIWLKPDEVKEITGWSPETLRRRAQREEIRFREVKGNNANGRASREYLLGSLPAEFHQKFFGRAAVLAKSSAGSASHSVQIVPFRRAAAEAPRIVLPDSALQAQAEHRLSVISRLVDYENLTSDEK